MTISTKAQSTLYPSATYADYYQEAEINKLSPKACGPQYHILKLILPLRSKAKALSIYDLFSV